MSVNLPYIKVLVKNYGTYSDLCKNEIYTKSIQNKVYFLHWNHFA